MASYSFLWDKVTTNYSPMPDHSSTRDHQVAPEESLELIALLNGLTETGKTEGEYGKDMSNLMERLCPSFERDYCGFKKPFPRLVREDEASESSDFMVDVFWDLPALEGHRKPASILPRLPICFVERTTASRDREDPYFAHLIVAVAYQYLATDPHYAEMTVRILTIDRDSVTLVVYTGHVIQRTPMDGNMELTVSIKYDELPVWPLVGLTEGLGGMLGPEVVGDFHPDKLKTWRKNSKFVPRDTRASRPPMFRDRSEGTHRDENAEETKPRKGPRKHSSDLDETTGDRERKSARFSSNTVPSSAMNRTARQHPYKRS